MYLDWHLWIRSTGPNSPVLIHYIVVVVFVGFEALCLPVCHPLSKTKKCLVMHPTEKLVVPEGWELICLFAWSD